MPVLIQTRLGERRELAGDSVDLAGIVALDHDPDLWLGARRADEDPSSVPHGRRGTLDASRKMPAAATYSTLPVTA